MRYTFFRFMAWLDDLLHVLDDWDWLMDQDWRFWFCQWSQIGLFEEEEKRGMWQ